MFFGSSGEKLTGVKTELSLHPEKSYHNAEFSNTGRKSGDCLLVY